MNILKLKQLYCFHHPIEYIIHVGAHDAEELQHYESILPRNKIIWIEGNGTKVEQLKQKFENIQIEEAILSSSLNQPVDFFILKKSELSSILPLDATDKYQMSNKLRETLQNQLTTTISSILPKYIREKINNLFLRISAGGMELEVLKGCSLVSVRYILITLYAAPIYGPLTSRFSEVETYLLKQGFHCREKFMNLGTRQGEGFFTL